MLYDLVRNRNKKHIYDIHRDCKDAKVTSPKKTPFGSLFYSEFRFITLTILIVIASLTMQQTVEDAINEFIRGRFKNPKVRIFGMFLLSLVVIFIVIFIVIVWKPPEESKK
jgi:hypothetical protein